MQPTTISESAPVAMRADADSEPSTAQLVAGMAGDVKRLGESYLELLRLELAQTLRKAAQYLAAALVVGLGAILLAVGAALALDENTTLSRGAAYAIVGGVLVAAGIAGLIVSGLRQKDTK